MHKHDTCIITTSVLLNHENYYARAITETDVEAIAIPANDFHQALALSHGFSHYILTGYAQRMAALLDRIASKDILYELSELLLRHADAKNVVTLTQQDMAREMGTARKVVSRKLSSLDDKGIVSIKRGRVILLKPQ